ncbi:MAG: cytochrome b N-terminal domain-containing protein [Patescibacteria group bacterium]|nr:cytochrome b N-terminal domain-containing protein [Patescibacteria group bacterium]
MNLTKELRERIERDLPMERLLPDKLPIYVSSFVYMFGILTLTSFIAIILSGTVMALKGPIWYQSSSFGFIMRSIHFWSVQVFFFFLFLHFFSVFFMAGWREGRFATWAIGSFLLMFSIIESFTGILMQGGFFAQWNQVQSKDAFNSLGLSGFFNVLNNGQLYGLHISVIPAILIILLVIHITLIRQKGVVPPIKPGNNHA